MHSEDISLSPRYKVWSAKIDSCEVQLLPKSTYSVRYSPAEPVIGFAYEVQSGEHALGTDRITPYRTLPNSLAFTPPACDVYSESQDGGEYLIIKLSIKELEDYTGVLYEKAPYRQFNNFIDFSTIQAACDIRCMLLSQDLDKSEMQTCIMKIAHSVYGVCDGLSEMPAAARSMTTARLKSIDEKIEDELAEPLTLDDLAKTCSLSKGFFVRSFKSATGKQPCTYLMERRVACARELLTYSANPIADIAHQCGFCSQAHMTTWFKKLLGVTPLRYRKLVQ